MRVLSLIAPIALLAIAIGQTAYHGDLKFKVGDAVEATYLGEWKKATVVGVDSEGKRYKIHFEGETSCNGHALDSFIAREWVRPRAGTAPKGAPTKPKSGTKAGSYRAGDLVLYRAGGPKWYSGATIEAYDAAKRQYRLRLDTGGGDILPAHSVFRPGDKIDNSFFIGKWVVFVSGSTSTYTQGKEGFRRFSEGMKLPPLEIKADGTYVWRELGGKVIKGKWRGEKTAPGITILKGADGRDWTVYESTEGYAPTRDTKDEIRFHHLPTSSGYYVAQRIGPNRSAVLKGRDFK